MPKRLNKPILVRTRDENGNYITLNMTTGSRKTNYQTKQSTSVNKPRRKQNVKRTLKPGEQVFTEVKQIFPDATDEQIMAIYQHMDKVPESVMGKLVKGADIAEDNPFRNYNSGKDIHIKKSKRGTFTKAAKQHGMSVQGFANKVLRNPSKYSAAMRKKANFARNASKWNK